jgi:hypothetical protein
MSKKYKFDRKYAGIVLSVLNLEELRLHGKELNSIDDKTMQTHKLQELKDKLCIFNDTEISEDNLYFLKRSVDIQLNERNEIRLLLTYLEGLGKS